MMIDIENLKRNFPVPPSPNYDPQKYPQFHLFSFFLSDFASAIGTLSPEQCSKMSYNDILSYLQSYWDK